MVQLCAGAGGAQKAQSNADHAANHDTPQGRPPSAQPVNSCLRKTYHNGCPSEQSAHVGSENERPVEEDVLPGHHGYGLAGRKSWLAKGDDFGTWMTIIPTFAL